MIHALPVLLLTAAVVRQDGTPLRSSCEAGAQVVASLPGNTPVMIRHSLAAGGPACYRVEATIGGARVAGYLFAGELDARQFEAARLNGAGAETVRVVAVEMDRAARASGLEDIARLIRNNRAAEALARLEPAARGSQDPNVLALAGIAAWKADEAQQALDYLDAAIAVRADAGLEGLRDRLRREVSNDRSNVRLAGAHILLRYEREAVSAEYARSVLEALERETGRISSTLGCSLGDRIAVILQGREAYLGGVETAWSGGVYDGRVRVSVRAGAPVEETTRSAVHELVHACVAAIGPAPLWLHEGLAQKLSGETAAAAVPIAALARASGFTALETMGSNWSGLDARRAAAAYSIALVAADLLVRDYASYGLRNLLANPRLLEQVTPELDRKLGF